MSHRLPPGPKDGYPKGGRPVKPRRAREHRGFVGIVVYELDGTSMAFTKGSGPLMKRYIGTVPKSVMDDEVSGWAQDILDSWVGEKKEQREMRSKYLGEEKRRDFEMTRVRKFLSEYWPATSRNKK